MESIEENSNNKAFSSKRRARARSKRRIPEHRKEVFYAMSELYRCFRLADEPDKLTLVQQIQFEEYSLDVLKQVVELFSRHCVPSQSIKYRLEEKTTEEEAQEADQKYYQNLHFEYQKETETETEEEGRY
jgi:hypothetical protein